MTYNKAQKSMIAVQRAKLQFDIASRANRGESYEHIAQDYNVTKQCICKIISRLSKNQEQSKMMAGH